MTWIEIRLVGIDGEGVEAVWETLSRYVHGSPVVEEVHATETSTDEIVAPLVVKAYVPDTPAGEAAVQQIREALWHLGQLYPIPEPETRRLDVDDWATVWQQHYHRARVGERLVIAPAWDETSSSPDEIVIRLDPGMAFGTGQHPSTQLCLRFLEQALRAGDRVYDVGAGSGVLSIAAVELGAGAVQAVDVDPVAIEATCENAARNGIACGSTPITGGIQVREGSIETFDGPFDLILVNILAETIVELLPAAVERLAAGGRLIVAGIIAEREDIVQEALRKNRLRVVERAVDNDWVALWVTEEAVPNLFYTGSRHYSV